MPPRVVRENMLPDNLVARRTPQLWKRCIDGSRSTPGFSEQHRAQLGDMASRSCLGSPGCWRAAFACRPGLPRVLAASCPRPANEPASQSVSIHTIGQAQIIQAPTRQPSGTCSLAKPDETYPIWWGQGRNQAERRDPQQSCTDRSQGKRIRVKPFESLRGQRNTCGAKRGQAQPSAI